MKSVNLTTATPPYKTTVKRTIEKVISPARIKEVQTGKLEIKYIEDDKGNIEEKRIPVLERVLVETVKKNEEIDVEVWIVETEYQGEVEKHEFNDEAGANNYYKGF